MDEQICPKGHCFGITRFCRVMPNRDPRDIFVHPYLTLMIDFFLAHFFVSMLENEGADQLISTFFHYTDRI